MKSDVLDELKSPDECNHFAYGRCDTLACVKRIQAGSQTYRVEFVGCDRYRAAAEMERLRAENVDLRKQVAHETDMAAQAATSCVSLRARVAALEHALRLSRVVVFGDSENMGLLDTTDGYYGWSDSPEVVLLREYVDTLIAKRPDGDATNGTGEA